MRPLHLALSAMFLLLLTASCGKDTLSEGLPDGLSTANPVHPDNYRQYTMHGADYLTGVEQQNLNCTGCHGEDFSGGESGVSCEQCHSGWKTNCAFCHGDGEKGELSGWHALHLEAGKNCNDCHNGEVDQDAAFIDASLHQNGQKNVKLIAGVWKADDKTCMAKACHGDELTRSWEGSYHPEGYKLSTVHGADYLQAVANKEITCTTCHGDELGGGTSSVSCDKCHKAWKTTCTFCHGDGTSGDALSGKHAYHIGNGARCEGCHNGEVDQNNAFLKPALHQNGDNDVKLKTGDYNAQAKSCSTSCHDESEVRFWLGDEDK